MSIIALAFLAGLGHPVADDLPTIVVTPSVRPSAVMNDRARAFIDDYFNHLSSPDALSYFGSDYAAYVSYYGKVVNRPTLMSDKARFFRRWPERSYHPRVASIQVSCDQSMATCTVTGLVDFECRSGERHAVSTGVARFNAGIWFQGDRGQLVAEDSEVIGRS